MDRTYWIQVGQFLPGEKVILQQKVVRLYDGDERTSFDSGTLQLTPQRLIWDDEIQEGRTIAVDLSLVTKATTTPSSFTRSAKISLTLQPAPSTKPEGPAVLTKANYILLSFRKGGHDEFFRILQSQLAEKAWEKSLPPPPKADNATVRAGIVGIERNIEKKQRETNQQVTQAFKDIDALIEKAKDMVAIVNKFAAKIEEKKGTVSEDETVAFKSCLLSAGIANPVTKETYGSGSAYHKELAKQLVTFLDKPLQESGGMMTLSDVYCRYNRARGLELVSPDDLLNACEMFEALKLPLRMRRFETGVVVVQSLSHSEEAVIRDTSELVKQKGHLSAQELSKLVKGLSIMLATERLLMSERAGNLCRDDTVEGLQFYPNRFLEPS
eukprot:Em0022g696a